MTNILEISGDDIALLNDGDLRTLIGLLCEAECRANGLPTSGVIWSGHQDAKDGGLDVVVENAASLPSGFVPRANTGFQVKRPDMPKAAIIEEMKPKGELREVIQNLIATKGSYIIISSTGSTSAKALSDRRTAMRNAVESEANHEDLHVDFYDRGRIASWVREHPSLIIWIHNKIGKRIKGWQAFANWTQPGEVEEDYLIDQQVRLYDGTVRSEDNELSIEAGINKIRSTLSSPGRCVRLAGLSGVGKTRFVQALFDDKIGEHTLSTSQVFYSDISNGPDPDPRSMAEQLIAQKSRAVVIVDNCPPDLHRKLVEVCSGSISTLSLITVEYDVREDLPEETHVFRLEPASDELIEKLINIRFKHISHIDTQTITSFSGGNARIAIALASTISKGETLSGFQNEELFERLFQQRNNSDPQLLKSAQALALVYSFDGVEISSQSELSILASLIGKNAQELYADVAELRDRNLIQARSIWRAILPQAIANRLAKKALNIVPINTILTKFLEEAPERLLKSFTRRLSYLHDSEAAIQITNLWLSEGGWLGDLGNLNELGIEILQNIASVSPDKALEAIERAARNPDFVTRSNRHHSKFTRLLRSIAFDKNLFTRSTRILCQFSLNEGEDENNDSTRNILKSLYLLFLSGTHAPASIRYIIIEELLNSSDYEHQQLALLLLDNSLEAWNFRSLYGFDFGARPRDYGYRPQTHEEVRDWYSFFLHKIVELILLDNALSARVKKVLADNFRGLWTKAGLYTELEDAVLKITAIGAWGEGWIEARKTLYFDKEKLDASAKQRLENLSNILKPETLSDLIKTYVLTDKRRYFDFIVDENGEAQDNPVVNYNRAEEISKELGIQLASDRITLELLLPELLSDENPRLWNVGQGLAEGCDDKKAFWSILKDTLSTVDESKMNITLLLGFLNKLSEESKENSNLFLDEIILDPLLKRWATTFQLVVPVDKAGIQRLNKILDTDICSTDLFYNLSAGRRHESIPDDELAKLLTKILSKENGQDIVVQILGMRFYGEKEAKNYTPALINSGILLLEKYDFSKSNRNRTFSDFNLNQIATVCLAGDEENDKIKSLCHNLIEAFRLFIVHPGDYQELLSIIAKKRSNIFLDIFVNKDIIDDYKCYGLFSNSFDNFKNPLDEIESDKIILWCTEDPKTRYPALAQAIAPIDHNASAGKLQWKNIVATIIDKAPDLERILSFFEGAIYPSGWSGSLADVLKSRIPLFQDLLNHENAKVVSWAKAALLRLDQSIERERERDNMWDRPKNESFE